MINIEQPQKLNNSEIKSLQTIPNDLPHLSRKSSFCTSTINLPYANVKNISFFFFLTESMYFSFNYLIDRLTFIITYILFNLGGFVEATVVSGLIVLAVDLFFCLSRDFQEAIGIVLGPYYSKGDAKNYYFFNLILIFWNGIFLLTCALSAFFLEDFFGYMGVESHLVNIGSRVTKQYMLFACSFLCISNYIKGIYPIWIFLCLLFLIIRNH